MDVVFILGFFGLLSAGIGAAAAAASSRRGGLRVAVGIGGGILAMTAGVSFGLHLLHIGLGENYEPTAYERFVQEMAVFLLVLYMALPAALLAVAARAGRSAPEAGVALAVVGVASAGLPLVLASGAGGI